MAEMRAFIDAMTTGTAADPGIEDGLRAQIMADAATQSCQQGVPVSLG